MLRALTRYPLIPAAWLGLLTLTACEARERPQTTGEAPVTADTTLAPAAEPGQPAEELSDANIVALLDAANQADSAAGALARGKATNPEVKEFARLMMSEHHALRLQGQQLAGQLGITPEPPANDPVTPLAESEMAALRSTAKGAQFDRVYIEQEVAVHKAVLDLADQAHGATDNAQLKALIEKAKPILQKHLDRAEELQDKLGEAAA
jgi:putative membrane protein